ncbi:glycosyltransferase [Aquicoccus porphyridii]|uniref:Glycosyltransferase n=1 Tax=Aquicoccus porphyridii TaxID=1852029 RepID=A0A5A9Z501_9RHOB|nr:glycosyltransferase [Aquicoccus porphyridii]KAA0912250.1 glycosyltransferase [Aquicoccus porphyridii]RAI52901.1 glycosyl transferase family 1 [Rhodobacteraceae bacterium AsT-22]
MSRPVIVFAGSVYPGQLGLLCEYLRREKLAESYFLTTPGYTQANSHRVPNLIPFQPDGKIVGPQSYYYSSKVERSARISRGLLAALLELRKKTRIDVIVTHSLWGAPHFLYNEIDAAIVSYIEFPSYEAHGWDPDYPPNLAQRLGDRNTEMLHFHQVLKSDLTIVPSAHSKAMFPTELHGKIEVQFEGFEITPPPQPEHAPDKPFTIGFAARDLSNAKGIDIYMRLADRLIGEGLDARFVAIGDPDASTYGYEQQWVNHHYGGKVKNFRDHALRLYPRAERIEFPGKLPYDRFASLIGEVDLFLYPLRFGVANWGLMEILARGGCVIAPDRGYASELIIDDVNGCLLPDDDDKWIEMIKALKDDPERRARYSKAARKTGRSFHISAVAPRYLRLFRQAMNARKR